MFDLKCKCPLYAWGTDEHGDRIRKSLGTRSYERGIERFNALLSGETGRSSKSPTDAVRQFIRSKSKTGEVHRRKLRLRLEKMFWPYCRDELRIEFVDEIAVESLDDFLVWRNLAGTTMRKELETLRTFVEFCRKRKWCEENVAKDVDPPKNLKLTEL